MLWKPPGILILPLREGFHTIEEVGYFPNRSQDLTDLIICEPEDFPEISAEPILK